MRRIVLYLMVTLFSLTANAYTGVYNLSSDYYTLSGQRITNPKPGIYIQGGRKVVIK